MKKKVLGVIAVVAVAAIAGYNVYTSQNDVKLSDLVLSNVEALANAKEGGNECIGCVYTRLQICRTIVLPNIRQVVEHWLLRHPERAA